MGTAQLLPPAAGDWNTIRFTSTAGNSTLDYVTILYGGSSSSTGMVFLDAVRHLLAI